jgi:putative transcriptional regulator
MTVMHHPSDETLAAFASGALDEPRAVVVATHVGMCAHCAGAIKAFEHVGGALLEAAAPAEMRAGALERTLARLDAPVPDAAAAPTDQGEPLPAPLRNYALGRWRRVGGGLFTCPVRVPTHSDVRVFLLKGGPGTRLLQHRHTGTEWTCVIQGAYRDAERRYGPGDFDEADESTEHYQVVEEGDTCIAVVAMHGDIRLQGFFGRLLQPFIRL